MKKTMKPSLIFGRDLLRAAGYVLQRITETNVILNIDIGDENSLLSEFKVNKNLPVKVRSSILRSSMLSVIERKYVQPKRPEKLKLKNIMKLTITYDKPIQCSPRRLTYTEKGKLREILAELIRKRVIRSNVFEYTSPIVLVKKKNNESRMCVDSRVLNKIKAHDNFLSLPISLIENQLQLLRGKSYLTTLDLKDGFCYIRMSEESIKYAYFVISLEQYEFLRILFGLKGARLK